MTGNLEEYYNTVYKKQQLCYDSRKRDPDMNIVGAKIPHGASILVLGCSTGEDVEYLTHNNVVYGLDLIDVAVQEANKRGLKARRADINKGLPYPDEMFDIIVCKDVLEHLFDPKFVMSEIYRVLKDNGYTVINVPNHFFITMRLKILLGKGILWFGHDTANEWDYFHIRFFTYEGFKRLLNETRFQVFEFIARDYTARWYIPKKLTQLLACWKPNLFSPSFYVKAKKYFKNKIETLH